MKSWQKITKVMCEEHPETAAKVLEGLGADDAARILASLPKATAAEIVERMAPAEAVSLFGNWNDSEIKSMVGAVSSEALGIIWQQMSTEQKDKIATLIDPDTLRQLQSYASYVPESVGAMADPRVLLLREDLTVKEAVNRIRRSPSEIFYYVYVIDSQRRLSGVVQMRDLLIADPRTKLSAIMRRELTTIRADVDREEAVNIARTSQFQTLPVVDAEGRFLGVVKTEDLLRVVQQEASEDVQKMFGAGPDEQALSPIPLSVRRRLPWLLVNLGTAFLAALVVAGFEDTIKVLSFLAVLMPIVAGEGGNTGAQSLAVMIRGLALKQIDPSQRSRAVLQAAVVGLINGIVVAVFAAAVAILWTGQGMYGLLIGIAMVANMVVASSAGALIPLVLKGLGHDPAQSSSIILTTVTDVTGFFVFLGLGTLFAASLTG